MTVPRFDVALRGYDRRQVDDYAARLEEALRRLLAGEDVDPPPPPDFTVALRGYDRAQVHAYIAAVMEDGAQQAQGHYDD